MNETILLIAVILAWIAVIVGTWQRVFQMPKWFENPPASFERIRKQSKKAKSFWIPLSILFILSLITSLVLNWQNDLARNYILAAFASFGIAGALSGLYFVKEVLAFSGMPVNAPQTPELIGRTKFWLRWTTVRDILNLLVALFVTAAYTHSYKGSRENILQSPKIESMENTMTVTDTIDAVAITHHFTTVNGIKYHYAEAGKGPLVIMLHGFPELWYSWRHQIAALANAGYHAVAPDLRGFGGSEVTPAVKDYSLLQHASDVKALIDQLGAKEAVIIGHDWGANLMWIMPMLYPETVKAVVSLSIPFYPAPRDPAEIRKKWSSVFTNFEKKGVVEAEFEKDPEHFFKGFFYGLSGEAPEGTLEKLYVKSTPNDRLLNLLPQPATLPSWISQEDLDYYVNAYKKTGITGALNFYRNTDEDYPKLKELYKKGISQPVLSIGGGKEAAVTFGSTEPMKAALPNLRKVIVLQGCGHWLQQERSKEVNEALIEFLDTNF